MDLDVFDAVARHPTDGSSRRQLVRASLGALGLTGRGLAVSAGKAGGKKKRKKKKRCKAERPERCGKGCCPTY